MRSLMGFRGVNPAYVAPLTVLFLGLIITSINIHKLSVLQQEFIDLTHPGSSSKDKCSDLKPTLRFTPYGKNLDSGYLKHVYAVLDRLGYERVSYNVSSDWDLMWAHDYPFKKIKPILKAMKKGQKVNKLPGKKFLITYDISKPVFNVDTHLQPLLPVSFMVFCPVEFTR